MSLFDTLREVSSCLGAVRRFRDYRPQAVTYRRIQRWLNQFDAADRRDALRMLGDVEYFTESRIQESLVTLNRSLLRTLRERGLDYTQVIYIQIDDAGSSSAVILNTLRNLSGLAQRKCPLLDGKDVRQIADLTTKMGEGAIVYVDDFIASGDQFLGARNFVSQVINGNFPEFVLVPCVCEEGFTTISREGIEVVSGLLHERAARPLHGYCAEFDNQARERLINWSRDRFVHDYYEGLGYKRLATSVVLCSDAPDTTPLMLRGSSDADFVGIFPRFSDLVIED
jgi:hypothetical protein